MIIKVDGVGYETDQHPVVLLDPATRQFNFQNDYVVAVSGDLQSQLLTIKTPRYYDGIDLYGKTAHIEYLTQWENAPAQKASEFLVAPTIDEDDTNYLLYPWVLDENQTTYPGRVQFAIKWAEKNTEGKYNYILRSQIGTFKVESGLLATSYGGVVDYTSAVEAAEKAKASADEAKASANLAKQYAETVVCASGAGAHNAVYRGMNLGTSITETQWQAIEDGTFDDLYIGDYWVINGTTYRIAAFDYYWGKGDGSGEDSKRCYTHHITIVPDSWGTITYQMNSTNTTAGGYYGSELASYVRGSIPAILYRDFGGQEHILNHRQVFCNSITGDTPTGAIWVDDEVCLMTEQNVYGSRILGAGPTRLSSDYAMGGVPTLDRSQFPLFAHNPSMAFIGGLQYWLRDVVSNARFACVGVGGTANSYVATGQMSLRPSFSIKT